MKNSIAFSFYYKKKDFWDIHGVSGCFKVMHSPSIPKVLYSLKEPLFIHYVIFMRKVFSAGSIFFGLLLAVTGVWAEDQQGQQPPSWQQPAPQYPPSSWEQPGTPIPFNSDGQNQTVCLPGQPCAPGGGRQQGPPMQYQQGPMGPGNMGQPPFGGEFGSPPMGGPNMMGPGQFGPSEEEMAEQEKRMDEQRFKMMKRDMGQFEKQVKGMKRMINPMKGKLEKCGIGLPKELQSALDSSDSIVAKVKAAKTADELEEIVSEIQEIGSSMMEWGPKFGELQRLCDMLKYGEKDFKKRFEAQPKKLRKQVERLKDFRNEELKADVLALITEHEQVIAKVKAVLVDVKALLATDPEAALEKLEDDFYGGFEDIANSEMTIQMVLDMGRGLQQAKREARTIERQINSLKNKGKEVEDIEDVLTLFKDQINTVNNAYQKWLKEKNKAKKDDLMGDLIDEIEMTFDTRGQLQEKLSELLGENDFMPEIKAGPQFNFKLPDSYNFGPGPGMGPGIGPNIGQPPMMGTGPSPFGGEFGPPPQGPMGPNAGPSFEGGFGPPPGGTMGPGFGF